LAARTQSYTRATSTRGRSNSRATLAVVLGIVSAVAIPLAIWLAQRMEGAEPVDAAWAIPIAAICAVAALVFVRGARRSVRSSSRVLLAARVFAVTGICLVLSSALAVAIYEFLVWKEN